MKTLKRMNSLFLFIIVLGVVFSEDVGFIYESTSGDVLKDDIKQYVTGSRGFKLSDDNIKSLNSGDIDIFNNTVGRIAKNKIRYIYGYLPSFTLEKINEVAVSNKISFFVPQSDSSELCLESVIYGYDRCHSAYSYIDHIKGRYRMNIIIGKNNECNAKLVKYVAQFGSVTSYSYLSEGYVKTDIEAHLQGVIENMTLSNTTLSIAIYNMYEEEHLLEIIAIFKDKFADFENKKLVNFNFEVIKLANDYSGIDETVEFVGEELNNDAKLKTAMKGAFDSNVPSTKVFTSVEIEFYGLLELLSQKLQELEGATQEQLRYALFNKEVNANGLKITMLPDHRVISPLYSAYYDRTTTPSSPEWHFTEIDIGNTMPTAQVYGQPSNITCDLLDSSDFKQLDGFFIVLSFYGGDNSRGYYESFTLNAALAAIDDINQRNGGLLGKDIIPIFIDGTLSDEDYMDLLNMYSEKFDISIFFISLQIADIIAINELFKKQEIFINIQTTGGEFCEPNIMTGAIPNSAYFQRSVYTLLTQYPNVFVVYSDDRLGIDTMNAIQEVTSSIENLKIVGVEIMAGTKTMNGQNVLSKIESVCDKLDSCIIVLATEFIYLKPFYIAYQNSLLRNATRYPTMSFALNEILIDEIVKESNKSLEGNYVMGYYFDSIAESDEKTYFKKNVTALYNGVDDLKFTSQMALSFSNIYLMKNAIELVYTDDYNSLKSVFGNIKVNGPGGILQWTTDGFSSGSVKLGYISSENKINLKDSATYIEPTHAFIDVSKQCNWDTSSNTTREIYRIVYLNIFTDPSDLYSYSYNQYFSLVIAIMNDDYNGIDGHYLKAVKPLLHSIDEMINYIKKVGNDPEVLAFIGTSTNEEREKVHPYLLEYNKLLFSVYPVEGEQSFQNIIQFGRMPHHYMNKVIGYHYTNHKNCIVIAKYSQQNEKIVDYIHGLVNNIRILDCKYNYTNSTEDIDGFVSNLKKEYPDGIAIYSLVNTNTRYLLSKLYNKSLSSSDYPVTVLDIVEPILTKYPDDKKEIEGQYFVVSFTYLYDSDNNIAWNNFLRTKYGEPIYLSVEVSYAMYSALRFLGTAIENSGSTDPSTVRLEMYRTTIELPLGQTKVTRKNMATIGSFLIKCEKDLTFSITLSITALLDIAQYSAILSSDGKQHECDYSISNVTSQSDLYTYGLWIKSNAENLQFMLSYYQNVLNSEGGNSGRAYSMVKVYCDDEEGLDKSLESDISFIISQCGNSTNANYNDKLKETGKIILSTQNEDAGICYSNIIQVGSSPAQRTIPMIQYLIDRYSTQFVLFIPKGFNETVEYSLLRNTITSQSSTIEYTIIVDENDTDKESLNLAIRDGLASVKRFMPSGGVILNYLTSTTSYIVFEKYFEVMSVYYAGAKDTSDMAELYPILTPYLRVYQNLPLYLRKGHLARIYGFANEDTNEKIYRFSRNILGSGTLTGEESSILMISFESFISVVTTKSSKTLLELIQSSTLSTSFGDLKVDTDNYLLHQMYIVTSDDDNNYVNNIKILTELYQEFQGRTYRQYFNIYTKYEICVASSDGSKFVNPIPLLFLVPLTGAYTMHGTDMLLSYLATVDYLNNKMTSSGNNNNIVYSPIVINVQQKASIVIDYMKIAKDEYKTRMIFGIYSSEVRRQVFDILENDELLLYYPVDYEGLECKKHIIYTGIPFGSKTAFVPIISQDYGSSVYIIYTDSYMNQIIANTVNELFEQRGVTVVNSIEIPLTGYTMSSILSIITSEFSSGAIISLLDGQTSIDFMKELSKNYDAETYRVFNMYLRHSDIIDNLEILNGHYYWQSYYEINEDLYNETNMLYKIAKNTYTHYTEVTELVPSCVLSILLNHYAVMNIKWNDTDPIGYSFDDLLEAVHKAVITEYPNIKPSSSNHLTYSIGMYQVVDKQLVRLYQYISPSASNPYETRLNWEGSNYCIWGNGLDIEKAPLNNYIVGLLFSTSGSLRTFENTAVEAAIAVIDSINRKGGINGKYLDYRIFDTESIAEGGKKAALQAVQAKMDVFIGCFLNGCRLSATDVLAEYNKTLWYPGVYDGQECNRSTYYTGLIPNQFMDQVVSYITGKDYSQVLYLVGDYGTYGPFIYNITEVKIGNSFQLYSKYGSTSLEIQEIVIDVISKMPNGGTIISTFSEVEFDIFLPLLESNVFVENMFQLIVLNIDATVYKSIQHTGLVDVIIVASYFDDYIKDNLFYQEVFNVSGRTFNTMYAESTSIALKLWTAGMKKLNLTISDYENNFNETMLESALFNIEVESGSGVVKMNTNHHTSLYSLMARWIQNTNDIEIVFSQSLYQDPMAWNWDIPETNGLVCDYSNPDIGAQNKVIALNILVAISQSGNQKDTDNGLSSVIELAVSDINSKTGGLLNKKLYLTTVDIASNDTICKTIIESTLKQKDYEVIFTTASTKCLTYITNLPETTYIPIFFMGFAQGETCVQKIIYSSREPSVLDRAIDIYLQYNDELTMRYVVVGNDEPYSIEAMKYVQKYVEFRGGSCGSDPITNFKIDKTDFTDIAQYIKETYPDGVTILFFGTIANHIALDAALDSNRLHISKYPIISYATGENMLGKGVREFFTLQTYFTSLNTQVNKNFVEMVNAYTKETISELMEDAFSVFNIWAQSVTAVSSTNSTILIPGLYNRPYDSPEGTIQIYSNNYLSHFLILGKTNRDGTAVDLYYTSTFAIPPNPYKKFVNDGVYICDFSKETIGYRKADLTVTIGLFVSQTGKNKDTERMMFYGLMQAVREINDDGGVLGKKIQVKIEDPQSIVENYKVSAEHFGELDEIKAVFGAGRYENLIPLAEIFSQYNKPYFYPGLSAGNICNAYTFVTQLTTNQISIAVKKYVSEKFNDYLIIFNENDEFSKLLSKSITYTLLDLNVNIYGPIDMYNKTRLEEVFGVIHEETTAVIVAVGIDDNEAVFTTLCKNGITGSKGNIYATTLNINVIKKIDSVCIKGAYTFTSFIKEMGKETSDRMTYQSFSKNFIDLLENSFGTFVAVTPATEAAYTAVKLWAEIVQNTYSFEADQIRNSLYGYSFSSPAGSLEVNTNGFTNRVVYLAQIGDNNKLSIIDYSSQPEEALAYDTAFPENKKITCDLTTSNEKQNVSSIKVIFLHESGNNDREVPILLEEDARVKDINYNKVNGYQVVPVVVFGTSEAEFDEELRKYENDTSIVAYIGCRSIGCRNSALKVAEKQKKLFMNLGSTEGNYCSESIINVGTTAYQKISIAADYCNENGIQKFYFIGDDSEESQAEYQMASAYVKEQFGFNMRSTFIELDPITEDEVKRTITRVTTVAEEDEISIFFALKGTKAKTFLTYVKDDSLLTRSMKLIFISYSYYDYVGYDLSSFDSSYVAISFHPILTSSLAQSFISDTQKNIGYNQEITEEIESVKIALDLWKTAMASSYIDSGQHIPSLNYISINMIGQDVSIPSGTLKIESNGYATRSVYLLEINQNGELNQLYPYRGGATIDKEARPYVSLPSKCKFGKSDEYFEYSVVLKALFFVFMGIGCACSIAALIFTIMHQNQRIIRSFGRAYSYTLPIVLLACSLSAIPMGLPPSKDNNICMARPIALAVCVKALLGVLLSKSTKIYNRTKRKANMELAKTRIPITRVLGFMLSLVLIEVVIVVLWDVIDPNKYEKSYSQKYSTYFEDIYIRECSISTVFTVIELITDGLICIYFLFISFKSRNASNRFNDSIGLFLSSCLLTVLGAVLVVLDFNINSEPDSVLIFRGIGVQIIISLLSFLQFGLKAVNLFLNDEAGQQSESGSACTHGNNTSTFSTSKMSQSNSVFHSTTMNTRTYMTGMTTFTTHTQK